MIDRAALALSHERAARQNDREHGDVVDDLHHAAEPRARQVLIKLDACRDLRRRFGFR